MTSSHRSRERHLCRGTLFPTNNPEWLSDFTRLAAAHVRLPISNFLHRVHPGVIETNLFVESRHVAPGGIIMLTPLVVAVLLALERVTSNCSR